MRINYQYNIIKYCIISQPKTDIATPIIQNMQSQNIPIMALKSSNLSPHRLSSSQTVAQQCLKLRMRTEQSPSPRKNCSSQLNANTAYTVHNHDKLKVFVKFKPPVERQFLNVTYINEKQVEIERQSTNNKIYTYDHVFHQNVDSTEVFKKGCVDIIDQILSEGGNGLIFVYGHTGTGKTFTMGLIDTVGYESKGIIPQSLKYIFKVKQKYEQKSPKNIPTLQISLTFNQIYMDEVYDMLDFQTDRKLTIRQHQTSKQPYIQNNICININSVQQAYQLLNIGLEKRRIGEQKCNKRSSRGHGLITVSIGLPNGKMGRVCFVDLAGSQRIKQSQSVGKTLKEAVHINTSLSALEALLMNIDEQSVRMYRGNKLTRLLQPFMQSGKIRLFVTSNYENIQPLQFAKRCKGIKFMQKQKQSELAPCLTPTKNGKSSVPISDAQISKLQAQVTHLQQENKTLTQLVTNCVIILNKVCKGVLTVLEDQNGRSQFTLGEECGMGTIGQIQRKVNIKINQLQQKQQQIMQKCSSLRSLLPCSQQKDDSINTSISISNPGNKATNTSNSNTTTNASTNISSGSVLPPQLHSILNSGSWSQLPQKLSSMGFCVLQGAKYLGSLCQYRAGYKKEIFTYAIKEELLQNKNSQLEKAVNLLLKNYMKLANNSGYQNGLPKLIKQLNQIGIQVSGTTNANTNGNGKQRTSSTSISKSKGHMSNSINMNTNTPKIKQTPINVQLGRHHSEHSPSTPVSKSIPLSMNKPGDKQKERERTMGNMGNKDTYGNILDDNPFGQGYIDDEQLFTNFQNNVNRNNKPPQSTNKKTSKTVNNNKTISNSKIKTAFSLNANYNYGNPNGNNGTSSNKNNYITTINNSNNNNNNNQSNSHNIIGKNKKSRGLIMIQDL